MAVELGPYRGSHGGGVLDHLNILAALDELRTRLLVCLIGLFVAFVVCFAFSHQLYGFFMRPMRASLPEGAALIATQITEIFLLHLQMSLLAAVFVVLPLWLVQLWKVAQKLRPLKTTSIVPILIMASVLFVLGAAFGHYVLFPTAVNFLTHYGSKTVRPLLSVGTAFSFYAMFVLGLGVAFQIPTVVYVLSLLNLVTPRLLIRLWKYVVLLIFIIAAILTPTPDVITQSLLAFPMLFLYVISILLCWLVRRGLPKRPGSDR